MIVGQAREGIGGAVHRIRDDGQRTTVSPTVSLSSDIARLMPRAVTSTRLTSVRRSGPTPSGCDALSMRCLIPLKGMEKWPG